MVCIQNAAHLIANSATSEIKKARAIAVRTLEYTLDSVDAGKLLKSKMRMKDRCLCTNGYSFDLSQFQNVYVVGGGKAAARMALALEEILGKDITEGYVNVPYIGKTETKVIELNEARHPVPDESGVKGARRILEIVQKAGKSDLVIVLLSGGGSSLLPLPRDSISLNDKRYFTTDLLKSGATIGEINSVRKHLSLIKGGWLAKNACPATVLNLIISDVVNDTLETIASGPTVPDSTTFADARKILERYDLWADAPPAIRKLIMDGEQGLIEETPKPGNKCFKKVYSVILGNCYSSAIAAVEALKAQGLNTLLLTSRLEGEARTVGTVLSSIATEIDSSDNPVPKPAAVVVSGETVVTVRGNGKGGRNQELALSAALKIRGTKSVVLASLSTDGVDGPTHSAGAIVDGATLQRSKLLGLNAEKALVENDSYNFFSKLGDLIITGPTGTNVNDISLILVL